MLLKCCTQYASKFGKLSSGHRTGSSWQMSTVQHPRKTWLATVSLLTVRWRILVSEAEIAPCLWALAPLVLPQSFVCEWAGGHSRLEPFTGKLSLFFFFSFSVAMPQFGLPSHVSSLRLSSGHSGLVLTLSIQLLTPVQPLLAGGRHKHLGYFSAWSCG